MMNLEIASFVVSLIGTFLSSYETACNHKLFQKDCDIKDLDPNDPILQPYIDDFLSKIYSEYREHFFSAQEVNDIINLFWEQRKDFPNEYVKAKIDAYIRSVFSRYDAYSKSQMTLGEKIVDNNAQCRFEKLDEKIDLLLNQDFERNRKALKRAVKKSKEINFLEIIDSIGEDYRIERTTVINQIQKDDCHLISIIGAPGSGKTVLCKNLLENEVNVLFLRAEKLASCNEISEIWNCDLESLLDDGFSEKINIFIDSLEFIADNKESVKDKLQEIFALSKKYENVRIVTSCRTSDKNSFIKLWSNYDVKEYELQELSDGEIESIVNEYPCLRKFKSQKGYSDLLKNPFYVNLIVSKVDVEFEIQDECELREYIWENVICLRKKASKYGVDYCKVKDVVEKIVFERAEKFSLGVNKEDLNSKVLDCLLSEKIVVQNGDLIRLSYDIFEDICFEHRLDRLFEECKGNYSCFFVNIDAIGKCAYRRYQIWISNKIFAKESREKFLHELIFSNYANEEWKKQTQIGIVKSKYCHLFFEQYSPKLISKKLLVDFIKIVNLYGFEGKFEKGNFDYTYLKLIPVGQSRECLIQIIETNNLYKNDLDESDILKLCVDYSNAEKLDANISNAICVIIEYYYDIKKNERLEKWYYKSYKDFIPYLSILYQLADVSKEWLRSFLKELKQNIKSPDIEVQSLSEKLAKWTLFNHVNINLVKELPNELCDLANEFWLGFGEIQNQNTFGRDKKCDVFGLSDFASDHNFYLGREHGNPFFVSLLNSHFWVAFDWAINFVNHCVSSYVREVPKKVDSLKIYFADEKTEKEYYGNGYLFLCSYIEHHVPLAISDIVYNLKVTIINLLTILSVDVQSRQKFAFNVREKLFNKSNNIALLSIILDVGLHFRKELPGYTLDLASNTNVLFWDIQRYCLYHKDSTTLIAENQMVQILGMFDLKKQYELNPKCDCLLRDNVADLQLNGPENLRNKCHCILDYLYSITKNEESSAEEYLQIQQMDMRFAQKTEVSQGVYSVTPVATGAAKNLVEEQKKIETCDEFLTRLFSESPIKNADESLNFESIDFAIDSLLKAIQQAPKIKSLYENRLVQLIAFSLTNKNLIQKRRDYLCEIWINGLNQYLNYESFISDNQMIPCLWEQLSSNASPYVKFEIKKLMLLILMFQGPNGIIKYLQQTARFYLIKDVLVAKQLFTTIVKLADLKRSYYDLTTNCDAILQECLSEDEKTTTLQTLNSDYDIEMLSAITNCGISLENESFAHTMKTLVFDILTIWNNAISQRSSRNKFTDSSIEHIKDFFRNEIIEKDGDARHEIDFLFDGVDFSNYKENAILFYQEIFALFGSKYFDSYDNPAKRQDIKDKIKYIEGKVLAIDNESVRNQFFSFLCLNEGPYYSTELEKLKTSYSYDDKIFVNEQFEKYGKYNLSDMFRTIQMLHLRELLPEILPSVAECLKIAYQEKHPSLKDSNDFVLPVARSILTESYCNHRDKIKKDEILSAAFESIADVMVKLGNEYAAVLQDEFRVY